MQVLPVIVLFNIEVDNRCHVIVIVAGVVGVCVIIVEEL